MKEVPLSLVATAMSEEVEHCTYASIKLDDAVLPFAKAAAAIAGLSVQDWLSDLANEHSARALGRKPVKRRPPKPREYP